MTVWFIPAHRSIRRFQIHSKETDGPYHLVKRTPREPQNVLAFFPRGFQANVFLMNKLVLRLPSKVRVSTEAHARGYMLFVKNQGLIRNAAFSAYKGVFFTMMPSMNAFKA